LSSYGERLGQNATFKGEGFKEATPYGNQEESTCEEKGREEKEALTNRAGLRPRNFFAETNWPPRLRSGGFLLAARRMEAVQGCSHHAIVLEESVTLTSIKG
jgi:hypothetical protein